MSKNFLLFLVAAAGILVVASLSFSQKAALQEGSQNQPQPQPHQKPLKEEGKTQIPQSSSPRNTPKEQSSQASSSDPTVKYKGVDHYGTYLIELIDTSSQSLPSNRDRQDEVLIQGRIDGKQFSMRLPRTILSSPELKLRITNLKSKEQKIIDATFLNELAGLPEGSSYWVSIDLQDPKNIQTKIKLPNPNGVEAFPTIPKGDR